MDGQLKRQEGSSKKRYVLWTDEETLAISGNEQRSVAIWKRIAAYYSTSPKIAECDIREASHCKQRWHKINDLVSKFCGAFEAATREKTSGQNETDVLKHAHKIFFNNHKKKFTPEHAWKVLRNDQKWCGVSSACSQGGSKRKKFEDADEGTTRPTGVKAAKARGKKPMVEGKEVAEFVENQARGFGYKGKAIEDEASGQSHCKTRTSC
ncbi:glutathione S-transferase T3-like [Brassica napus]|uniref:glutathione S-transferase T3-like n=1 Tax=Brassica napus TaxID=3708 RepID=UPI0006AB642A|nr:glutathione S-transferase T3-like [Brassica napus]